TPGLTRPTPGRLPFHPAPCGSAATGGITAGGGPVVSTASADGVSRWDAARGGTTSHGPLDSAGLAAWPGAATASMRAATVCIDSRGSAGAGRSVWNADRPVGSAGGRSVGRGPDPVSGAGKELSDAPGGSVGRERP